ncbi:hypothetical protein [Acidimangrovimonas sediminis]|uniref:hypothetical protein n=1 Tax=Acidimangrovimonas sediminis TaxID=2056283 RepID=UPI000C8019C2|nr:hypothetical protein [Acidimangrovimonas sediminis]
MRTLKLAAAAVTALALAAPVAMAGTPLSGSQKAISNGLYGPQVTATTSAIPSVISGQGKS